MLDRRARDIEAGKFFLGPRKLKPEYIYDVLRFTASDMRQRDMGFLPDIGLIGFFPGTDPIAGSAGFDFDSGFGMVDAERALHVVAGH